MEEKIERTEESSNMTHAKLHESLEKNISEVKKRILETGDLAHVSMSEQLRLLDELSEFPLGRFKIERRGLNGFWTDYVLFYPGFPADRDGENLKPFSEMEDFIINRCPTVLAHRERFKIFQRETQRRIRDNIKIASIPCGLMRDLLTLNYKRVTDFELVGIDIDDESLALAKEFAMSRDLSDNASFYKRDAWNLGFVEKFDLITSSGLNVYERDNLKVIELYKEFYRALKPQGVLIVSILTYPPGEEKRSEWRLDQINQEEMLLERTINRDILRSKWQNYRNSEEIQYDLKSAGFDRIAIIYDKYHIFPTVVAEKK